MMIRIVFTLLLLMETFLVGEVEKEKFIVITPPKCGTHLITQALRLMGNVKISNFTDYHLEDKNTFIAALDLSEREGYTLTTHLPADQEVIQILRERRYKILTIIRDPRDQLISSVHWILSGRDGDFLFEVPQVQFSLLSYEGQIEELITGERYNFPVFEKLYARHFGWLELDKDLILITRFEDLVGEKGGGSGERQMAALLNISSFIGLPVSQVELQQNVVEKLFGKSPTFRSGKIDGWKSDFTERHHALFNRRYYNDLHYLGYD